MVMTQSCPQRKSDHLGDGSENGDDDENYDEEEEDDDDDSKLEYVTTWVRIRW